MRRMLRSERGQAMVEMAIALPVFILIMVAVLDAGRVFNVWITVTNGAREGARAAATRQTEPEILDRIDQAMIGLAYDAPVITTDDGQIPGPSGSPVTVVIGSDVTIITPVISQIMGAIVHLEGRSTMQLE